MYTHELSLGGPDLADINTPEVKQNRIQPKSRKRRNRVPDSIIEAPYMFTLFNPIGFNLALAWFLIWSYDRALKDFSIVKQ